MRCLIIILIAICLTSCWNIREARRVSKNFSRECTGIDTLIRIDGYYYWINDSVGRLGLPLFFFEDGRLEVFMFSFETHEELQSVISHRRPWRGSYRIYGDTIRIAWVKRYAVWGYIIHRSDFLIKNDTTLKQFFSSSNQAGHIIYQSEQSRIFHFHELNFPTNTQQIDKE